MTWKDRTYWAVVAILSSMIIGNVAYAQNPFTLFGFGANVDTNSGNKSTKTQRVTLATDQVQLTNALKVDASATTQPVSGTVTANMGTVTADPFGANADAASATGSISAKLRFIAGTGIPITGTVTVASHAVTNAGTFAVQAAQSGNWTDRIVGNAGAILDGATGAAPPANVLYIGGLQSGATGGLLGGITVCDLDKEISITANTQLITGVSGRKVRICHINLVVAAATNVAIVSGTGSTCGTGTTALMGGTTAATGWNLAANGGIAAGSGLGEIATAHNAADNVCILVSAANQTSGNIKYTIY